MRGAEVLELCTVGAGFLAQGHEFHGSFETAIVIGSDVSDEVGGLIRADQSITDAESAHAMLLAQGIPLGTSYWRGSSTSAGRVPGRFQTERSA